MFWKPKARFILLYGASFVALFAALSTAQDPFVLGPGTQQKLQNGSTVGKNASGPQTNNLGGLPPSSTNLDIPVGDRIAARPRKNIAPLNRAPMLQEQPIGQLFQPGEVVARVGGYPIFRGDVMADINQLIEVNMAGAPEAIKKQQREMALPVAVDRAIEQKLLFVDAIRSLPEPEKLPELKQSIREQFTELRLPELMKNLKAKNPAEAEAKLRKLGTSLRQVRESWIDGQLAGFFVRDKVNMNPEITHFEMLEFYNANRKDYHYPAQVRWEQIMVRFDKYESREKAWEELGRLGNEIVYGANFSAVARKSSHGFEADKGGYNDWTTKGSLVHEEIDQALFSLPVNQLSDRIESKIGFHIVRVIERKTEGYRPFSECQKEIRQKIKTERQNKALKEYVERLKEEIPFENLVSSREKHSPETIR